MRNQTWRTWPFMAVLAALPFASATAGPPEERVTPQFSRPLAGVEGKTLTSVIVDLPPGGKAVPHRHGDAFVYAFVLSGRVRSALDDQPPVVYRVGQDWYEAPGAHHVLTENVSRREHARLLVVFVASTGAKLKIADTEGDEK